MRAEPKFEEIRPRTQRLGHRILHLARVGSTMDVARQQAAAGAAEGLVVVAEEQDAGVGRHGRSWFSPRGGLLATLILRPAADAQRLEALPLAAGVAMGQAIERLVRVRVALKWPNDLVVQGKKVGGVLVEGRLEGPRPEYLLLGVGVNGDARADAFPPDLRATATSLSQVAGRHVCMPALLKLFLDRFEPLYDDLQRGRTEGTVNAARARMETLGRRVRVETARGTIEGVARDLDATGALLVDRSAGLVRVNSGECEELRDAA